MTCRYPASSIVGDYLRAAGGLAVTSVPALVADFPPLTRGILLAVAVLFAVYGYQAFRRHHLRIQLSDEEVMVLPRGPRVRWSEVRSVVLSYFSVRRDGGEGWMELKLIGAEATVRVDSRLQGFDQIVRRAADAARVLALELDPTTASNFSALGITPDEQPT